VRFALRGSLLRRTQQVQAVQRVSLEIREGETLAIVGESGSGKTSLARALLGLVPLSDGRLLFRGREILAGSRDRLACRAPRSADDLPGPVRLPRPALERAQTSSPSRCAFRASDEQAVLGQRVRELLVQVGLPEETAARYPHQFSGGQRQRIAIARALAPRPRLIIADEPLSALDVSIRSQVMNLLRDLQAAHRLAYLLVSHDFAAVHHLADRVAVMYLGRIVETASVHDLFAAPSHPYTRALLASVPRLGQGKRAPGSSMRGDRLPRSIHRRDACSIRGARMPRRSAARRYRQCGRSPTGMWRPAILRDSTAMIRFAISRLLGALAVLVAKSFVLFCLIGLMPGDPVDLLANANPEATAQDIARASRDLRRG
jgi:oligopeptide/dipeptide ABC transporter ATP-binding protein